MSDLISRSALIEKIKERIEMHSKDYQAFRNYSGNRKIEDIAKWDECEVIIDIARALPTVEAKPGEEIVIKADKIQSLRNCLENMCLCEKCDDCEFFKPSDTTDGKYFCAIRDKHESVPFRKEWDMSSAFTRKKV